MENSKLNENWIVGEYKWISKDSIMPAEWVKLTTPANPKLIVGGYVPVITGDAQLVDFAQSIGLKVTTGTIGFEGNAVGLAAGVEVLIRFAMCNPPGKREGLILEQPIIPVNL